MARTNQGIFHDLKNNFRDLENKYNQFFLITEKVQDGRVFFSDFAFEAESLYTLADFVITRINCMLDGTKFELPAKKSSYQDMLNSAENIKSEVIRRFAEIYSLYKNSGSLDAYDEEELHNYRVYRDL